MGLYGENIMLAPTGNQNVVNANRPFQMIVDAHGFLGILRITSPAVMMLHATASFL